MPGMPARYSEGLMPGVSAAGSSSATASIDAGTSNAGSAERVAVTTIAGMSGWSGAASAASANRGAPASVPAIRGNRVVVRRTGSPRIIVVLVARATHGPSWYAAARAVPPGYFAGAMNTPQGRPPTGIVASVASDAVSTTLTLFERPFAVQSLRPSAP